MNKEQTIMICPQCGEIDGSCKDNYDCPHAKCIRCGCDMIPTEYIKRDVMLFNVNGKIDRKALMAEYVNGR